MSEFHFGVGTGKVSQAEWNRCEAIAKKHGASFCNPTLPNGARFWFSTANRGAPFNDRVARDVMAEVGRVQTLSRRR